MVQLLSGGLALLAASTCTGSETTRRMNVNEDGFMIDDAGRVRIFHGFNDVQRSKASGVSPGGSAYLAKTVSIEENARLLAELGFNAVRFPMMWAGAMPAENTFDEQYYNSSLASVRMLGSYGIYSLLDMHQDVLSSRTGSYDGAPRWLVDKTVFKHDYPWPFKKLSSWGEGYVTDAVGRAFQDIYSNTHGGLDAWADFWQHTASKFRTETSVLGYELMNEPWAGSEFQHPTIMLPGQAGEKNLLPAYDKINAKIREVDDETIIFYEPVTWGMVFPGSFIHSTGSGFDHVPGGPDYRNRSVLSFHYYCWFGPVDGPGGSAPMKPVTRAACESGFAPKVFNAVAKDLKKLGGGSMVTEFGAQTPDVTKPDAEETEQLLSVLDQADKSLQSWTYWDINSLANKTGTSGGVKGAGFQMNKLGAFVRTYAQAIAGTPTRMQFDFKTKAFELDFTTRPNNQGLPTEIFVPGISYPNGFTVETSDNVQWKMACDPARPHVLCVTSTTNGAAATVKVQAK